MPLILGTNSVKDTGFDVENSLRQNRADSSFLFKTFDDDGTHHDKGTISVWVKRTEIGAEAMIYAAGASAREFIRFETNDTLTYRSVGEGYHLNTNRVFKDPSAWYHIVVAFDSSQGTASNRNKIYVNGVQETSFATETYTPNQNMDHKFLSGELQRLGRDSEQANPFANCYFCEVVGIDGVAHGPTSFGEFDEDTGIWKPIKVSGLTFGTNGFHLNFADSSALGTDVSGNSNTFANTNFAATDQSTDTCTNNFATMNPLVLGAGTVLSEGALQITPGTVATGFHTASTMGVSTGKWYWEATLTSSTVTAAFGIIFDGSTGDVAEHLRNNKMPGEFSGNTNAWGYKPGNSGAVEHNAGNISYSGATADADDILGFAMDLDNGAFYIHKNGTYMNSGNPTSGASKTGAIDISGGDAGFVFPVYGDGDTNGSPSAAFNFGSPHYSESGGETDGDGFGNFNQAVPSGYFALCSKNLAEYGG